MPDRLSTPFNHAAELIDFGFSEPQALRQVSGDWTALIDRVALLEAERVRWVAPYVSGDPYKKNDMVLDGEWTMIANKDTTDNAAPVESGNPVWALPAVPAWTPRVSPDALKFGAEVIALGTVKVSAIRVWISDITYEYTVQVWDMRLPGTPLLIDSVFIPAGNAVGWYSEAIQSVILNKGDIRLYNVIARSPVSNVNYTDNWRFFSQDPPGGGIVNEFSQTEIRINNTAGGAGSGSDRSADLLLLGANDEIVITALNDASRTKSYLVTGPAVNAGTYVSLPVSLVSEGDPINNNTDVSFDWTVVVVTTVDYTELTDWFLGNQNIRGYIDSDIDSPTVPVFDDNAYGVDVLVDNYIQSPDWDVVAV